MFKKSISHLFVAGSVLSVVLSLTACNSGNQSSPSNVKIDNVDGPYVSLIDGRFSMTALLKNANLNMGLRVPVPHTKDSYVEIAPDVQSSGTLFTAAVSINDLIDITNTNASLLDPMTLPGGRPLPGIAAGYLPGIAVLVPQLEHTSFYIGSKVFGVFVPVKLPIKDAIATFRFFDTQNTQLGNVSIVGTDGDQQNSGFLLMIDIKGKVKRIIDYARATR